MTEEKKDSNVKEFEKKVAKEKDVKHVIPLEGEGAVKKERKEKKAETLKKEGKEKNVGVVPAGEEVKKEKAGKEKKKEEKVKDQKAKKATSGKKDKKAKKPGDKEQKTEEVAGKGEKVKKPKEAKRKPIERILFHGKQIDAKKGDVEHKKKKKPGFFRQELCKFKKLKDVWRRPRGIDSKKRREKRGKGAVPQIGYKNPESIRYIDPSGYYTVLVHNFAELEAINPKKEAAIIARTVGRKKRNQMIKAANDLKITILNPRKGEIPGRLGDRNILMIIARKNFRDEEFLRPRDLFESEDAKITVASTATGTATGMLGAKVTPDTLIDDITDANLKKFDAVVFIGGTGAEEYLWGNKRVQEIAKSLFNSGKIVAAICLSPVILARTGILKGKRATVFP